MSNHTRLAIVSSDRCKPSRCGLECKKFCPPVKMGKLCIEVKKSSKTSNISEELCIGCGICIKKCPFNAISIINLPRSLEDITTHRYGLNSFKLHRLPIPRRGQVLGLIGPNGIGKSTVLKILAGRLKPNFGDFNNTFDWRQCSQYFRGSDLQNYFGDLHDGKLKVVIKPQYVESLAQSSILKVSTFLENINELDDPFDIYEKLELNHLQHRNLNDLSGGEMQRVAIAYMSIQKADVYLFDEPSSFLDVKQRLNVARVIRHLLINNPYVVCVEHDIAILDYLSDNVCILYGKPSVYGVVTMPFSVSNGINHFLAGFIPTENLRFREHELNFKSTETVNTRLKRESLFGYPNLSKKYNNFKLDIMGGDINTSEIIVMLGENGMGKTTFLRQIIEFGQKLYPDLLFSYKPQKISPKYKGTVLELFRSKIGSSFYDSQFQTDVLKPLAIDDIIDNKVNKLSGGELQRVAIVLCLGVKANIYLIDEPSAYLDSEQRLIVAKIIRRFIFKTKTTAFIVEHDFIMSNYLADRVIVYEGVPGIHSVANSPQDLLSGMNKFLRSVDITYRRDYNNYRPRINKEHSQLDQEQKERGQYYFSSVSD